MVGLHDIYTNELPPNTRPIPITRVDQRIGVPYIACDIEKVAAVVYTSTPDIPHAMAPVTDDERIMAGYIVDFLKEERAKGRLPENLLPLQSGVGSVSNAVLDGLRKSGFKHLTIYSEVLQDSVLRLMEDGVVDFASATAMALSPEGQELFWRKCDFFKDKIILRPQSVSNSPEVVHRLGVIAMNAAIEVDVYGNVNSSHFAGSYLMNGIGGSGDFARNAYISIFTCPSTLKDGKISAIVPMVAHADHTEHDVRIVVTEYGVADLRGKGPDERAKALIENCAHPDYRNLLWDYLKISKKAHVSHNVAAALALHTTSEREGDMRLTDFNKFC